MYRTQKSQFDDIVLWIGRPLFKPYLINHIFSYQSTIRLLLFGSTLSLFGSLLANKRFDWNSFLSFLVILFVAGIIQILLKIVGYRNTKYWITKDAVYIQTGVIRPTVVSIQKDKIIHIDIKKSGAELKQSAGTVIIDDGETQKRDLDEFKIYKNLIAIKNPEEAIRLL